jgi:hypothetical protein
MNTDISVSFPQYLPTGLNFGRRAHCALEFRAANNPPAILLSRTMGKLTVDAPKVSSPKTRLAASGATVRPMIHPKYTASKDSGSATSQNGGQHQNHWPENTAMALEDTRTWTGTLEHLRSGIEILLA